MEGQNCRGRMGMLGSQNESVLFNVQAHVEKAT